MKQLLLNLKSGALTVEEVQRPVLRAGGILVRNDYSLISAGTERAIVRLAKMSVLGKLRERPDLFRPIIERAKRDGILAVLPAVRRLAGTPIPLGYCCSGTVIEVGEGASRFSLGDRVACGGLGYANHAGFVFVPQNLAAKVPDGVPMDEAAFATIGAIAMQGVRVADVSLGENVAVIGLGLIGQLTVQLLRAAGCRVIGTDLDSRKIDIARKMGMDEGVSGEGSLGKVIAFCGGIGADKVLVAASSRSGRILDIAASIARDRGVVVIVGDVPLAGSRRKYYEKELEIRLSRSSGPGRYDPQYEEKGIDYPIGYVRWTENRNMELFLHMVREGKIDCKHLITHRFAIDEAVTAFKTIAHEEEFILGALLTYGAEAEPVAPPIKKPTVQKGDRLRLGVIGAGRWARGMLLPAFQKSGRCAFRAVVTAGGATAKSVSRDYGCDYVASHPEEIMEDDSIDAVIVATRHDLHAALAVEAMRRGKIVFVEKPMALNREELSMVIKAQREFGGRLMVGFNRRFASFTRELLSFYGNRKQPMAGVYRVNAGALPPSHWTHDPREGGGRIIGEVCHFIDWYQAVFGCRPRAVQAAQISGTDPARTYYDTFSAILKFEDGSIGTICYYSNGEGSMAKERVELFCGGSSAVLDNFRRLSLFEGGKERSIKRWRQDKGIQAEVDCFVEAALSGGEIPIPFESLAFTTQATFAIVEAIRTGASVEIDPGLSLPGVHLRG
jgi:predicted dehydrogenase/threonine dehydrogenase-like Zn-dependent dehydrogenase